MVIHHSGCVRLFLDEINMLIDRMSQQMDLSKMSGPHRINYRFPQEEKRNLTHHQVSTFVLKLNISSPDSYVFGLRLKVHHQLSWVSSLPTHSRVLAFVRFHNHVNQFLIINIYTHTHTYTHIPTSYQFYQFYRRNLINLQIYNSKLNILFLPYNTHSNI